MTWQNEPANYRNAAEKVCTPAELEVLRLYSHGYGRRRGSLVLGISPDQWRNRLQSATRKINQHLEETAA